MLRVQWVEQWPREPKAWGLCSEALIRCKTPCQKLSRIKSSNFILSCRSSFMYTTKQEWSTSILVQNWQHYANDLCSCTETHLDAWPLISHPKTESTKAGTAVWCWSCLALAIKATQLLFLLTLPVLNSLAQNLAYQLSASGWVCCWLLPLYGKMQVGRGSAGKDIFRGK